LLIQFIHFAKLTDDSTEVKNITVETSTVN